MFYCESCQLKNEYPWSVPSSFGKCEVCGKHAPCIDGKPNKKIGKYTKRTPEHRKNNLK